MEMDELHQMQLHPEDQALREEIARWTSHADKA